MEWRSFLCLVAAVLLSFSASGDAVQAIFGTDAYSITVLNIPSSVRKAQMAALNAAADANVTLSAVLVGGNASTYANDVATASGVARLFMVNATAMTFYVRVSGLTGTMPPFQEYIRVFTGPYKGRIVFGVPNSAWAYASAGGIELFVTWLNTDIFPRAPNWSLQELFNFLFQSPGEFQVTVHTLSYIKGAISGVLFQGAA